MGKEQACQRVPGAERYRQVLAYSGEIRQLDRRLHSDHDAIRPVVTDHPGINFVEARKALSRCHFLPVAQHTLDQTPLALPGSRSPYRPPRTFRPKRKRSSTVQPIPPAGRNYLPRLLGFLGVTARTSAASCRTFLLGLCMSLPARERCALVGLRGVRVIYVVPPCQDATR
jgi:hypothetical protein